MTREEFIKVLDKKGYSYKIKGDKIVVTYKGSVDLKSLTSLSPGVDFNNKGYVDLWSLTSLPPGVVFNNKGNVNLNSLKSLPPGVQFNNKWYVRLESLVGKDGFEDWKGNIKGIDSKRLLNFMISKGVFEK